MRGGRKAGVPRQTRIANDLRETKVASADDAPMLSAMAAAAAPPVTAAEASFPDPPTRDVLVDPPTRDVPVFEPAPGSADEPDEAMGEETVKEPEAGDLDAPAQFGIVARKRVRAQGEDERGTATTLKAPGVQIVKGDKETSRDAVFAPREQMPSGSGRALGRLKLAPATPVGVEIATDDPDLPAVSSAEVDEPAPKPRISLDRLKLAMKRREEREAAASEASEAGEAAAAPADSLFEGAGAIELSEPSELMFDDISDVEDIDLGPAAPAEEQPAEEPPVDEPEPEASPIDEPEPHEPPVEEPPIDEPEPETPPIEDEPEAPQPGEPPRHTFPWSLLIALIVFGVIGGIAVFVATL